MKKFSLNFSDQKIEREFNKLKEANMAEDFNVISLSKSIILIIYR